MWLCDYRYEVYSDLRGASEQRLRLHVAASLLAGAAEDGKSVRGAKVTASLFSVPKSSVTLFLAVFCFGCPNNRQQHTALLVHCLIFLLCLVCYLLLCLCFCGFQPKL